METVFNHIMVYIGGYQPQCAMKLYFPLLILVFFLTEPLFAQDQKVLDSLEAMLPAQSDSMRINTYSEIIALLMYSQGDKTLDYLNREKETALRIGADWAMAHYYKDDGAFNIVKGDYAKAEASLMQAKAIYTDQKDSLNLSKVCNNLSYALMYTGNMEKALEQAILAMKINEKMNTDRSLLIGNYMAAGNIISNLGRYDESLSYYRKAEALAEELHLDLRLAQARHNIGENLKWMKKHEEALSYFKNNISYYQKAGDTYRLAMSYNSLGTVYFEMDSLRKSKPYFEQSYQLSEGLSDSVGMAYNARNLGRISMAEGFPSKALFYYTVGMHNSQSGGNNAILVADYLNVSQAYAALGNYKDALEFRTRHQELRDSIVGKENVEKLNEIQTKYETEKKEAEIALQKVEISTLNEKAKVDKLTKGLYAGGMFTFVAVSGLLFFGFRQRMKKNQVEREKQEELYKKEIEYKQKELASQTLHLVQKNTFLEELKANLENFKDSPERFKMEFRRITMLLKKEKAADRDWETFKAYFSEVHNDFDQKLKTFYPDISEKEVRLAAFLRMNLTTKEIAATMNVLPNSILTSKYRLKKKLGLDKDTELGDFLNTL